MVKEEKEHELDQMKLSFFINVAHEFRTPLTLILNPLDKILESVNLNEAKESAKTIQQSSHRLLNLVNQILDFRKVDEGKAEIYQVTGDVNNVFKRFYKPDNTKAGTGIGLNYTKSLLDLLGGEIKIESCLGEGTTITVLIPFFCKIR